MHTFTQIHEYSCCCLLNHKGGAGRGWPTVLLMQNEAQERKEEITASTEEDKEKNYFINDDKILLIMHPLSLPKPLTSVSGFPCLCVKSGLITATFICWQDHCMKTESLWLRQPRTRQSTPTPTTRATASDSNCPTVNNHISSLKTGIIKSVLNFNMFSVYVKTCINAYIWVTGIHRREKGIIETKK